MLADFAQDVLDTLVANWPADPDVAAPLPERQYITNGMVVWDCEQLVVMIEATYGTEGDPGVEATLLAGLGIRAATIDVALLRCVPVVDDEGDPPPVADIETASIRILNDSEVVLATLLQAQLTGQLATCNGLSFERGTFPAPQGGLAGSVTKMRAALL